MTTSIRTLSPWSISALELAVLAFYADPRFDSAHSAPCHPAVITSLVARELLRPELGAFVTTPAGIRYARAAGYTSLIVSPYRVRVCGTVIKVPASLESPAILRDGEVETASGTSQAPIVEPERLTIMLVSHRPRLATDATGRACWAIRDDGEADFHYSELVSHQASERTPACRLTHGRSFYAAGLHVC